MTLGELASAMADKAIGLGFDVERGRDPGDSLEWVLTDADGNTYSLEVGWLSEPPEGE